MDEASNTTPIKIFGDRITTNGGTGSIFLVGVLIERKDESNINTAENINDKIVQVVDDINSDSESDEGSKFDMEYSAFMVDDE